MTLVHRKTNTSNLNRLFTGLVTLWIALTPVFAEDVEKKVETAWPGLGLDAELARIIDAINRVGPYDQP
jgi:hypothetical protein